MRRAITLRTTNGRFPFLPNLLSLPITKKEALDILFKKGYERVIVEIVCIARSCVGKSVYQWNHHPDNAPNFVDCASFVRWLYSQYGIWLPRYSIQQHNYTRPVDWEKRKIGDLIFSEGSYGKYWLNSDDKIGHVGMLASKDTVIHAAGSKEGVIESGLDSFTKESKFRGVRRMCELNKTIVLKVRPGRLVENLDDVRWDILNSFGR